MAKLKPLVNKWIKYTKTNVNKVSNSLGAYQISNDKEIIYIGEGQVKTRLIAHITKGSTDYTPGAKLFRYEITNSKDVAVYRQNSLLKQFIIKFSRLPKCNIQKFATPPSKRK
jgi:hypothetical protein